MISENEFNEALDYFDNDEYEEVLQYFEKIIKMDLGNQEAWFMKALTLINLKRDKEALEAIEVALELDPDDAEAWVKKAWILELLHDAPEGLHAAEMALDLDEYQTDAVYLMGKFLLDSGKFSESIEYFKKYPENEFLFYDSLLYQGTALFKLGKNEEAEKLL
ncbi:MAG: tetratricopeptide repeat protein, partial [Methanobacterium sp.]|nr:tetratricopeptide repeat protein [Methanobacterium sp.]